MAITEEAIRLFEESGAIVLADAIRSFDDIPFLPKDVLSFPEDAGILENIGITSASFTEDEVAGITTASIELLFATELKLDLPGLEGFALVVGAGNVGGTTIGLQVEFGDAFAFRIRGAIGLRFSENVLKLVEKSAAGWTVVEDGVVELRAEGAVEIDGDGDIALTGFDALDLSPAMIGESGVVLEFSGVSLVLSSKTTLPETHPPEIGPGWRGVLIENARIHFAGDVELPVEDLAFSDCYIGSGGFTGEVSTTWSVAPPRLGLGGVEVTLHSIHLGFRQNVPTASTIAGALVLPFFEEPVDVEIGIGFDGAFSVSLASDDGILELRKTGILALRVDALGIELEEGTFVATIGGSLTPEIGGLDWPSFEVKELRVDGNGDVRVDGGWLDLPEQYSLDFYGFDFEITKLGFGRTEDGGNWVGFSGGLKLVDGMQAGGSVEGLRVTWYPDGRTAITLNGVGVELEIPGTLRFKGEIAYRELPGGIHRFDGAIRVNLLSLGLEVDGRLVVGTMDGDPFFALHLGVELPAGIPLFSTGLGLYGFAGLFALEMEPGKAPDEEWYGVGPEEGWYKKPEIGVSDLQKWDPRRGSLGLGAGVTLGTLPDNGFAFSGRFLLVIVFPGPVVLLEGKANILKERSSLSEEPVFRALAVLDGRDSSFLVGLDARYRFGGSGELIDIRGGAEAFFDFDDPEAWHLYIGEKDPKERRIRARLLSLFDANAYFMLDHSRVATGAWVGYDADWRFGPLRVELEAWIEGNAVLSWMPAHLSGDLWLHGKAKLSVFGFGLGLSIDARFAAGVFDPFHVLAEFRVGIGLPWPLPDFEVGITLEWGPEPDPPALPVPLKEIAVEHFKVSTSWPLPAGQLLLPVYDADGDGFLDSGGVGSNVPGDLGAVPVVPLDARPHITFGRPVHDDAAVGVNPQPVLPDAVPAGWEWIGDPERNEGDARARYGVAEIALEKLATGTWEVVATAPSSDPDARLWGSWAPMPQLGTGEPEAGSEPSVANTKLWIWSRSPFDYTRRTGRSWEEWFTDRFEDYPCIPPARDREICCHFDRLVVGRRYDTPYDCAGGAIRIVGPRKGPFEAVRLPEPIVGHRIALCPVDRPLMTIQLSEPSDGLDVHVWYEAAEILEDCFDFTDRVHASTAKNPLGLRGAAFQVEAAGATPPVIRFVAFGRVPVGLELGTRLEVVIPCEAREVALSISHFSSAPRVDALDEGGRVIDSTILDERQGRVQRVELRGPGIRRVVVTAPQNEALLHELCYACGGVSTVRATGFDAGNQSFGPFLASGNRIHVTGSGLVRVHLESGGPFCLVRVCTRPGPDPREVVVRQEMSEHLTEELIRWSQVGPVLEPYSRYRVRVRTTVETAEFAYDSAFNTVRQQTHYAYFRTEGPPGLAELSTPIGQSPEEHASGLEDLSVYVRQTIPPTVAAQGEPPLLPRPVYRAYDVGVEFNEDYVDLLYRISRRDLGIYLFDNSNRPVRDAKGRLVVLANRWGRTEDLTLTETEQHWIETIDASSCAELDTDVIPRDVVLTSGDPARVLEPDRLHEARLVPLLFHEDFSRQEVGAQAGGGGSDIAGWTAVDVGTEAGPSRWTVREQGSPATRFVEQDTNLWGGSVEAVEIAKPGALLLVADRPDLDTSHPSQPGSWTDYRLTATMRGVSPEDDAIGVVFRYVDSDNHYRFSMDRERRYRRLVRFVDGDPRTLAEDDASYTLDRDYRITVECNGPSIRAYVDGAPVFAVEDATIPQGRVGLYCWAHARARFNDVRVDDYREGAPVVHRFEFTTSRYANFLHQLHGFEDETWFLDASAVSTSDLAAAVSAAVSPAAARGTGGGRPAEPEARHHDALAGALLGAEARQWPETFRVSRVEHGGDGVGLLCESPEPIDWARTTLELSHAAEDLPEGRPPGAAKLIDLRRSPGPPEKESLAVLLREAVDPTGFEIQESTLPGALQPPQVPPLVYADDFANSACGLVFEERFGSRALDAYEVVDSGDSSGPSAWSVEAGAIVQTSNIYGGSIFGSDPDRPGTMAVTGSGEWRNIVVEATVRSLDDDAIGVVFRYRDEANHYRFAMDRQRSYRHLVRVADGVSTLLWEDASAGYALDVSHLIRIEAYEREILVWLDGAFLARVEDATHDSGRVGFYCWANVGARFEALRVQTLHARPLLLARGFVDLSGVEIVDAPAAVGAPSAWAVDSGALVQTSSIQVVGDAVLAAGTHAVLGSPRWTDVGVSVRLRTGTLGATGLVFRYRGESDHYRFSIEPAVPRARLVKVEGGTASVLWEASPVGIGAEQVVTIRVEGRRIAGTLDGRPLFDVQDNGWRTGRIALYCAANPDARFEELVVTDRSRRVGPWRIVDDGSIDAPSHWSCGSGELVETSGIRGLGDPEGPGTLALLEAPVPTDFRLRVELRTDTAGVVGAVFRVVDDRSYYRLELDALESRKRLLRSVGGVFSVLWEEPGGAPQGEELELEVVATAGVLRGYLDGPLLFEVSDATHGAGGVGLYARGSRGARFRGVRLEERPVRATPLLGDRFAEGGLSSWTFEDEGGVAGPGAWAAAGGWLVQTSNIYDGVLDPHVLRKRGTLALAGDPAWSDLALSATLRSDDDDAIGVVFRYQDANNFYRFSMDTQRAYRRLVKNEAGSTELLWGDDFQYEVGRSYDIVVIAKGDEIRVYQDGLLACAVTDSGVASGRVGLYCWANQDARFRGVSVDPVADLEAQLEALWHLRDDFAYLDVVGWRFEDHGIQDGPSDWRVDDVAQVLRQRAPISDGDLGPGIEKLGTVAVADVGDRGDVRVSARVRSLDGSGALGVVVRYLDVDNHYRFSMDRSRGRRLTKTVHGVTETLWSDEVAYEAGREYALTVDARGDRIDVYVDAAPVASVRDGDLGSGWAGLYTWATGAAEFLEFRGGPPIWSSFYRFDHEDLLPAGSVVRVHSGSRASSVAPSGNAIARPATRHGEAPRVRFGERSVRLRVRDRRGKVLHARAFHAADAFAPVTDVRILRGGDRTRCFLFVPSATASGASLAVGTHRLRWVYDRDNRAQDPQSLVLSQAGVREPEEVLLDVPWRARR